jgi:hypothetical protein
VVFDTFVQTPPILATQSTGFCCFCPAWISNITSWFPFCYSPFFFPWERLNSLVVVFVFVFFLNVRDFVQDQKILELVVIWFIA